LGECAATGQKTCQNGVMVDSCTPGTPSAETCDLKDNNCDGLVDNMAPVRTTCGQGVCAASGRSTCVNGQMVDTCTPNTAASSAEICDGKDNDCDGTVDDGIAAIPTTCGGLGECAATGQKTCQNGVMVDSCTPGTPSAETCDLKDNNCDGLVDNISPTRTSCGVGSCLRYGKTTCINGVAGDTCVSGTPGIEGPAGNLTCSDHKDNDCDGATDAADTNCQ
jgi:hypothetical protein